MNTLPPDEKEFLTIYRTLDKREKRMVRVLGEGMAIASFPSHYQTQPLFAFNSKEKVHER